MASSLYSLLTEGEDAERPVVLDGCIAFAAIVGQHASLGRVDHGANVIEAMSDVRADAARDAAVRPRQVVEIGRAGRAASPCPSSRPPAPAPAFSSCQMLVPSATSTVGASLVGLAAPAAAFIG